MFKVNNKEIWVTPKMFEKHLWKSDILSKDAGRWLLTLNM